MTTEPAPKPRRWGRRLLAAAAITVVAGGVVMAQYHHGPRWRGGGYDDGPRWERGGMDRQARFQRFCSTDTSRWHWLARTYVKGDLRLTNEQATEFDKFADGLLPQLEELKRDVCAGAAVMTGPAPERLKKFAEISRKVAEIAERNAEPFGKVYALLDAGQKARVDLLMTRRHGRMGGPGMMGPRMGGPGERMTGDDDPRDEQPRWQRRWPGQGEYRGPAPRDEYRGPGPGEHWRRGPGGWRGYERGGDDAPGYPGQRWQ